MRRNIVVTAAAGQPVAEQPVEMVERKGLGHPDSLCDGIAEQIARDYACWCESRFGAQLHHNFDKVQIVAGQTAVAFGAGEMIRPIRVQIAGRGSDVTPDGRPVPMQLIAIQAARDYLRATLRHLNPDRHCVIDCFAGSGAGELVRVVSQVTANDTSFGVAHWPLSPLERLVLDTADFLNRDLITRFPIGEDIKVMGLRCDGRVQLTCAVPFLCTHVFMLHQYRELKAEVRSALQVAASEWTDGAPAVLVNAADDEDAGAIYLTLTGTSAECGDDGAVGRGNRVTGLITPLRPVSLEAAAGKNAISHAGKLYNVLALKLAQAIVAAVPEVWEANVLLLSQIGRPLDQPQVATAVVRTADGDVSDEMAREVTAVMDYQFETLDSLRDALVAGELRVF